MPTKFPVPTVSRLKVFVNQNAIPQAENVAAFRACHQRFEECLEFADGHSASPLMETAATFVLDFDITAKRTIGSDLTRYRLFQLRYLMNSSKKDCCEKLNLTDWTFASETAAIEREVGAAFSHAKLFPLAPYFTESNPRLEKIAA